MNIGFGRGKGRIADRTTALRKSYMDNPKRGREILYRKGRLKGWTRWEGATQYNWIFKASEHGE